MDDLDAAAGHRTRLGLRLRDLRTERSLTLRDLALRLDVSPATLSAIENGKTGVSSERLSRIAALLEVPVHHVLTGTPDPPARRAPRPTPGPPPLPPAEPLTDWRSFAPLVLDAALTGALSAFLEFGYHGATMRTIAERAGLSVPGLYHHYASKQEMLVALLDLTMSDLRRRTESARAEGRDPVARFALIVECLALYHTHRRELAFVGASEMRSLHAGSRERVAGVRRDEQRLLDAEVEAGVAAGAFRTDRPHEASRAVVTMCTALAQWFRHDGPASAEQVAEQYVGFALDLARWTGPARPGPG